MLIRQKIGYAVIFVGIIAARAESPSGVDSATRSTTVNQDGKLNVEAVSLVRRALETTDPRFYAKAQEKVNKSFKAQPDSFDTGKIQTSILLGEHRYTDALELAMRLNRRIPDDVAVYGLLAEAYAELGDYKNAEISAQWMLNLRPGNRPALLHAAHLRDLFGELDGSYELFDLAYQSTVPSESQDRAYILTQMGRIRWEEGKLDGAEKIVREALKIDPEYIPALAQLAEICIAKKHYDEAIPLLEARSRAVPRADALFDLAEAYGLAGRNAEEKETFANFLAAANNESARSDNSNLDLIYYYCHFDRQPAKAMDLARREYALRKDVYTLDAYAWALHTSSDNSEARKQLNLALAVGGRDPKLLQHSAAIQ